MWELGGVRGERKRGGCGLRRAEQVGGQDGMRGREARLAGWSVRGCYLVGGELAFGPASAEIITRGSPGRGHLDMSLTLLHRGHLTVLVRS